MKIIEPQIELWQQSDPIPHVAKCARVCYGNAVSNVSKGEKADDALYDSLAKAGHNSMFRHQSVYAIVAASESNIRVLNHYVHNPYIEVRLNRRTSSIYIATNQNFMIDNREAFIWDLIVNNEVTLKEFENADEIAWKMMRYTFHITTQISTLRELNRVSPNSIAERSTRYCSEKGVICRPHWLDKEDAKLWDSVDFNNLPSLKPTKENLYLAGCMSAFNNYNALINLGVKREDARGILPLDTATEVVYTYSIDEWRHIIALRSDKKAHPNCQIITNMIKKELKDLGYDF